MNIYIYYYYIIFIIIILLLCGVVIIREIIGWEANIERNQAKERNSARLEPDDEGGVFTSQSNGKISVGGERLWSRIYNRWLERRFVIIIHRDVIIIHGAEE